MTKAKTTDNTTDSKEEEYFIWYLEELMEADYITKWSRAETITLSENVPVWYVKPMKKGPDKPVSRILMQDAKYTPDFEVTWHPRACGIFYERPGLHPTTAKGLRPAPFTVLDDKGKSLLEIKGGFIQHSQGLQYSILAKWTYAVTGRYVQRVQVSSKSGSIFDKTFCPARFQLTDKTCKSRAMGFRPKTLKQFVNTQAVLMHEL